MESKFTDKVIMVTGASSGIGREICIELAKQGASLIMLARNEERLAETMTLMPEATALTISADLTDFNRLPEIVEKAFSFRCHIDGFAHCAGIGQRLRLRDTTINALSNCMNVHCFSFVELIRLIVKKKKKSQLLKAAVMSSLAAQGHDKYLTAYSASKAALEAAVKSMSIELMSKNVLVNIVRSAFVNTPMIVGEVDLLGDFEDRLKSSNLQPLGIIPPSNVAQLFLYLLGPDSNFCTGATFTLNAGAPC